MLAILGLSGGVAVGTALLAIYAIFDFVSCLRQYSTDRHFDTKLEATATCGALSSCLGYLFHARVNLPACAAALPGLLFGCFVGLLTASLSDVIGIVPIVRSKRKSQVSIPLLLCSLAMGRVAGSLYFFFFR